MRMRFCYLMSVVLVAGLVTNASGQTILDAPQGTITVDGDLSDWAALPAGPNTQDYQMLVAGNLSASLSYAWDNDNLYLLLQETLIDDDPFETGHPNGSWEQLPYFYDTIALFRKFGSVGDQDAPRQDFWIGLTSDGTQRFMSRINEPDPFDFLTTSVHGIDGGLRFVELSIPMNMVLASAPVASTTLYMSPLYCDGPWDNVTQEMIGGTPHPGVQDPSDRTYVHLVPEPAAILLFATGGLLLRRRRLYTCS